MATGSALLDAIEGLVDALDARTGLAGVTVGTQGPRDPGDVTSADGTMEAIWVGDTASGGYRPVTLKAGVVPLEETWTLHVVVQVIHRGTDQTSVTRRAVELLDEVLLELQNDPTLGQTGYTLFQAIPGEVTYQGGHLAQGTGHGARFELDVDIQARIANA